MSTPPNDLPRKATRPGPLRRFVAFLRRLFRRGGKDETTPPNIYPLY